MATLLCARNFGVEVDPKPPLSHPTGKHPGRLTSRSGPDLLLIDDFGLRRLTARQSSDLYEVILERHRRDSTIVTARSRSMSQRRCE